MWNNAIVDLRNNRGLIHSASFAHKGIEAYCEMDRYIVRWIETTLGGSVQRQVDRDVASGGSGPCPEHNSSGTVMSAPSHENTAPSHENAAPTSDKSAGTDVVALAPSPPQIVTRNRLPRTKLGDGRVRKVNVQTESGEASLVTRRHVWLRRRRRKRLLMAVAVILALFPPMWALYLVAWLIWRSRPKQQSMRGVRKAVQSLEKNRAGMALRRLQDAHLLDPSNTDALYWLGLLLSRQGRYEEAEEALSIVADRVPGLPEVEGALAEAYVATDAPDRAVYHAQRLLDVAPYAPETLLKLSAAFEACGKLDLAIQTLEQAPLHKPTLTGPLVEIHYRLGALHERQGDTNRALHHFKRVYARDITYHDVQARLTALETASS